MQQGLCHTKRVTEVIFGIALLWATPTTATPWSAAPDLLPAEAEERLKVKVPTIESPGDLQNLLRTIGRQYPTLRLEAYRTQTGWRLEGEAAKQIADIELITVTRFLYNPIYTQIQKYIGQVASVAAREKIEQTTRRYLTNRGYPQATVSIEAKTDPDGRLIYYVSVEEGDPCIISRMEVGFSIPPQVKLPLTKGDICDTEDIEAAVSRLESDLRELGYNQLKIDVADIEYDAGSNSSSVYITGVLGQRIRYEVVDKDRAFLIGDLFGSEELTDVDPTIVGPDAMAAELERRYRNNGFLDVVVKGPSVNRTDQDLFVYSYEVTPGTRYILTSVQFEGVTVFQEEELLEVLNISSLWQTTKPLNLDEIEQGLEALRVMYQSRGYWDVKIRDPGRGTVDKETGTVRMTIRVDEGLPRTLAKTAVKGNKFFSDKYIGQLLGVESGQTIDRAKLVDFQQSIRAAYISEGFLYANVSIQLEASAAPKAILTSIVVSIEEGGRVKIGDVTIVGLIRTRAKVVRRELLFATGEWYNPENIANTRRALTRLGLFRSVQIIPADRNAITRKDSELDLVVQVAEGKAGNVSFGPGWDFNRGWLYSTEASYNNIGGVGRKVSIRGSFSEEANQGGIGNKTLVGRKVITGYVEPYVLNLPLDATVTVSHTAEAGTNFWVFKYGGRLGLSHTFRRWIDNSRIEFFYDQEIAKTEGEPAIEADLVASDVRIGRVGVDFQIDARNSRQFPTDGSFFETELAWARYGLIGDLRYFKWGFRNNHYFELIENIVLALGVAFTSYEGIERKGGTLDLLPLSERLSLGGSGSIRGFRQEDLGPVVRTPKSKIYDPSTGVDDNFFNKEVWDCTYQNNPPRLGGTKRTVINTEMRYKIDESWASAFFVDSGNVFFSNDQMARFAEAYNNPAAVAPNDPNWSCPNEAAFRSVEDNVAYEYRDLLEKPGYLISRHYLSYGIAGAFLSPLGSINVSYGLPWQEPKTQACTDDPNFCEPRGKQSGYWLFRGEFNLYVAAEF